MSRQIVVYNTLGNNKKVIQSSAENWEQLTRELEDHGIQHAGMKAVIGETQVTLESGGAKLYEEDFTLFLMPQKVKSGNEDSEKQEGGEPKAHLSFPKEISIQHLYPRMISTAPISKPVPSNEELHQQALSLMEKIYYEPENPRELNRRMRNAQAAIDAGEEREEENDYTDCSDDGEDDNEASWNNDSEPETADDRVERRNRIVQAAKKYTVETTGRPASTTQTPVKKEEEEDLDPDGETEYDRLFK